MPTSEAAPRDDSPGLSSSRAEFAANLQRRLESALAALSEFEDQPASPERRDNFLRRVHALRASAKVLGFAAASEILTRAEQQIRTCPIESPFEDIRAARKELENLPHLVFRGAYSLAPLSAPSVRPKSIAPLISEPLAVVVWGTADLIDTIRSIERTSCSLEVFVVEDPQELRSTCAAVGPDVLLLDANQGSITLLVDDLAQAPETSTVPIVVANVPDGAAPGLHELGARLVLPVRANEHHISHALFQVRHAVQEPSASPAPLGDITLKDLAERLAQEIRQGLVDSAAPNARAERIPLGDGTSIRAALWSALAQIRDHIVDTSAGRIHFTSGPEGGTPLAPRSLPTARARASVSADAVDLAGRRILVVDDDPAVAWFVGGTLRAAGAVVTEVHDGAQALETAYRIWPELIVSDIMMPGLDGFALCHAIKRDVLLRDLPIVLLSWKEDLLFRLRDLGADADGYLRKEASASTIVRRVKELLLPRSALERRLAVDQESRGRLDGTTTRLLLELATALDRPVRIALRDAAALYDMRLRHGTLVAVTRTRHDGTVEHGDSVLGSLLGIAAARFSVVTDREPCEAMFSGSLSQILQPSVLRARAAQRVLSGSTLGMIDRLTIAPDAFGSELPPLPFSLRPIADELLRGTAPRQLLATGVASAQLLESLLSDVARRGAVRSIEDVKGQDLLEREILLLQAKPAILPPKPAPQPLPQFTFQLSPVSPEVEHPESASSPAASALEQEPAMSLPEPRTAENPVARDLPPSTLSGLDYLRRNELAETPQPSPEPHQLEPTETPQPSPEPHQLKPTETPQPSPEPHQLEPVEIHDRDAVDNRPGAVGLQAATSVPALTAPNSLLPRQFTVTSNPPPSDDFDWAMELSWDSTPPPAGGLRPAAMPDVPRTTQTAPTASDFMRPSIPTLDRRTSLETPDLAVAVARAVSEATPSSALSVTPAVPANRTTIAEDRPVNVSPSPSNVADAKRESAERPSSDWAAPVDLTTRKMPGAASPTAIPNQHDSESDRKLLDANTQARPTTARVAAESSSETTKEPHQEPLPTFNLRIPLPPSATATVSAPETAPIPRVIAGPVLESTEPKRLAAVASFVDAPSPAPQAPRFAESPIALPAVHQPPRPKDDDNVVNATRPVASVDRPNEDPVFPLFPLISTGNPSTIEIQTSVETHPSIDVGTATSQVHSEHASEVASNTTNSNPAQTHDTLRSPPDAETEPLLPSPESQRSPSSCFHEHDDSSLAGAVRSETAPNSSEPERAKTLLSPTDQETVPRSIPTRSPRSSPIPVRQPRQVGWIQALGLAALAGIITFAVTVPIASWVHRRHEPVLAEPPVAVGTLPSAASVGGLTEPDQPLTDAPRPSTASGVESSMTAVAPSSPELSDATPQPKPTASIEEIPVPSNVTLKPGEAVIEVTTAGDHAIFVDDAFVGRGPIRVIPVSSGRHVVRARLNGTERSDPVEVGDGRAVRLSLE